MSAATLCSSAREPDRTAPCRQGRKGHAEAPAVLAGHPGGDRLIRGGREPPGRLQGGGMRSLCRWPPGDHLRIPRRLKWNWIGTHNRTFPSSPGSHPRSICRVSDAPTAALGFASVSGRSRVIRAGSERPKAGAQLVCSGGGEPPTPSPSTSHFACRRQVAGGLPHSRWKARLKAASDS